MTKFPCRAVIFQNQAGRARTMHVCQNSCAVLLGRMASCVGAAAIASTVSPPVEACRFRGSGLIKKPLAQAETRTFHSSRSVSNDMVVVRQGHRAKPAHSCSCERRRDMNTLCCFRKLTAYWLKKSPREGASCQGERVWFASPPQ